MIGISDNKATAVTATTTMILPYPSSYHPLRTSHNKPHATHRSKIEIVNSILVAVSSQSSEGAGAAKTRIMFQTELSWTQLRKYISYLIANELLTCRPATQLELDDNPNVKQFYMLTTKAKIFLRLYDSMNRQDLLYGISESGEERRTRLPADYQRKEEGGAT